MTDAFDIYNQTGLGIVIGSYTVPANSFVSILSADAVTITQNLFFYVNLMQSNIGIASYGTDLGSGPNSLADIVSRQVASGFLKY